MFSGTTELISGAMDRFCNIMGSTARACASFGGQCFGRSWTGFYDFQNRRSSQEIAVRNNYGACMYPINVGEDNYAFYRPYPFDVQLELEDYNSVIDSGPLSQANNGYCACRNYIISRTCDNCVPGHFTLPECLSSTSVTEDVTDQSTAVCRDEYFELQGTNAESCAECFDNTSSDFSSDLSWIYINGVSDWSVVNITNRLLSISPWPMAPLTANDSALTILLIGDDTDEKLVYFRASNYYLGELLTSYGGYLSYTILHSAAEGNRAITAADIIIEANDGYIVHNSIDQPPAEIAWTHTVMLVEEEFINLDGSPVSRDQFVNILCNVEGIYVRATYGDRPFETSLLGATMDIGIESSNESENAYLPRTVEYCECLNEERGVQCEPCAEGSCNLFFGFCVPCQCEGHSKNCYVNVGGCIECAVQCTPGYNGDATPPFPSYSDDYAPSDDESDNDTVISNVCWGFNAPENYGMPDETEESCAQCFCGICGCLCCGMWCAPRY